MLRGLQSLRQTVSHAAGAKASAAAAENIPPYAQKIVGSWLIGCAGMVFGAVVLGGVTRLVQHSIACWQASNY